MKNALLFLLVCLLPLEVFGWQEAGSGQKALVFTDVTVIDATGAPAKPDMTVVIKGGRIAALGKTANLDVPENAQVVDATGKFLIPGLWDMHIHPWLGKNYLALFTANGVTGVRVMEGEPVYHKWRQEISAGKLIGPRMVISSPIVDGPESILPGSTVVSNEGEGRQVVRKVKKEGADFVKVFNDVPRDAYFAIADEAKKQGIPFAGHVPFWTSAAEASDAGQQSIEHCPFVLLACSTEGEEELKDKARKIRDTRPGSLPYVRARMKLIADITYSEKKAAELFARFVRNGTWVCPTLIVWHGLSFRDEEDLANDPRLKYMPLSTKDSWNPKNDVSVALATGEGRADFRKLCEKHLSIVGAMRRAGVGLLAGSDATGMVSSPYCFPGFGLHDELAVFVQAGLSPMEALQTATYNPAKFFGKLDSMGTIEQGKIADLVLLDANPLQDISNTQKIAAVVVGGKIFDKTTLQKMLAQVEDARLHQAAADGNIEHVRLLISEGADVNAKNNAGETALDVAMEEYKREIVKLLVAKGAEVSIHVVAFIGDINKVKDFLERGGSVDTADVSGQTLLHWAAAGNHKDIAELLISNGANFNVVAGKWKTPLGVAARTGSTDVAEYLIAHGANVNAGEGYWTPLQEAAYYSKEMVELLLAKGANINTGKWTALHSALDAKRFDIVELLLAKGADANIRDGKGRTPLHIATWYAASKNPKIVELLLSNGVDINAKDEDGRTPLWYAQNRDHTEIIELLRKHGAKE